MQALKLYIEMVLESIYYRGDDWYLGMITAYENVLEAIKAFENGEQPCVPSLD